MSKIQIRLVKEWDNAGTKWPEGQLLNIEEADASGLVDKGFAEMYEPKAGDVIKVSPITNNNGGMGTEDIQTLVKAIVEETTKATTKPPISKTEEEYQKRGGYTLFSEFCHDIFLRAVDKKPSENFGKWLDYLAKAPSGASEQVDSDGGFLVPEEFRNTLLTNSIEASLILPRATVIPMQTSTIKLPMVDVSSHASSLFGGVIIYRPAEGGTKTASKPKFGRVELNLHKLVGLVYATDELLEDSPISLEPLLTQMFSAAIAWQQDEDFIHGTGAGMALGILNAPATVSVAKETGQAATTIETNNITKMFSRMYPPSAGRAVWFANNDSFPQLSTLTVNVGTGGSNVGLIQYNGTGIAGAPYMTLLGKPLILTEHCKTIGTVGDIIFADWSQYLVGQKAGGTIQVARSIHVKFTTDETAFRFVLRYDGQPWWLSALTPKHSSNTLSPFITLATRS